MAALTAACSSGGNNAKSQDTTTPLTASDAWASYNKARTDFDPAQTDIARQVAQRITSSGINCSGFKEYSFSSIALSYRRQGLPLALGAGACTARGEEVLIEVFGTKAPNADNFVAAKRRLICQRAKDLGRKADGSSDFDGIPYVMAPDKTWIVEPDSFDLNGHIADALKLPSADICVGIK
jgi:hypothetical protein